MMMMMMMMTIMMITWLNTVQQRQCVSGGQCSDIEVADGRNGLRQRCQLMKVSRKQAEASNNSGNMSTISRYFCLNR